MKKIEWKNIILFAFIFIAIFSIIIIKPIRIKFEFMTLNN